MFVRTEESRRFRAKRQSKAGPLEKNDLGLFLCATCRPMLQSSGLRSFDVKHLRAQDRLERIGADARLSPSPSEFSGTWVNTNTDAPGITYVTCTVEGNVLRLRLEGNGSSEPSGWGEATAELLCAASIHGGPAMSFIAGFDLGFKKVQAGANLNQGLLVMAFYHSFQNHGGGSRSNYFSREFFHRAA